MRSRTGQRPPAAPPPSRTPGPPTAIKRQRGEREGVGATAAQPGRPTAPSWLSRRGSGARPGRGGVIVPTLCWHDHAPCARAGAESQAAAAAHCAHPTDMHGARLELKVPQLRRLVRRRRLPGLRAAGPSGRAGEPRHHNLGLGHPLQQAHPTRRRSRGDPLGRGVRLRADRLARALATSWRRRGGQWEAVGRAVGGRGKGVGGQGKGSGTAEGGR